MSKKVSKIQQLANTKTTYYTVPAGKKTSWLMTWVCNTSNSGANVSIYYYDATNAVEVPIFNAFTINSKTYLDIGGQYNEFVQMYEGDEIRALCTRSSTAIFSLTEESDIIKGG